MDSTKTPFHPSILKANKIVPKVNHKVIEYIRQAMSKRGTSF